jgi:hypothetical protein
MTEKKGQNDQQKQHRKLYPTKNLVN